MLVLIPVRLISLCSSLVYGRVEGSLGPVARVLLCQRMAGVMMWWITLCLLSVSPT